MAAGSLAPDGDRVVGWGAIATSDYDNLDLTWFRLALHLEYRRRAA